MNGVKYIIFLIYIFLSLIGFSKEIDKEKISGDRKLLIRYKKGVSKNKKESVHFSAGAYVTKTFKLPNRSKIDVVEVAKGISLDAAYEYYRENKDVLYVEPNYLVKAFFEPPPLNPTPPDEEDRIFDPVFGEQWGLNNNGQTGGVIDVDINAPEMWQKTIGSKDIVIAVIDTGVNYNHPDLKNNIWTNQGEIPGNNIDDDNNGVVDDIHGYNASDLSGNPMDDNGHGSHCAGIIGAEKGNYYGGSGVMPNVSIIGCKFLDAQGGGSTEGAIACLEYLRDLKTREENPVNIFASSNSWGGGEYSLALKEAIQAHEEEGILFIAAASNNGEDNDEKAVYPSNYKLANIISVAAIDHDDKKAWFSNYGQHSVHVAAPGVDILSTMLNEDYDKQSGTSMAAPFVTGLAGMLKAYDSSLNFFQIRNLLISGGVETDELQNKTISGRRIRGLDSDGVGSLTCLNQIVTARLSPIKDELLVPVGEKIIFSVLNINCSNPNGEVSIAPSFKDEHMILKDSGEAMDTVAGDGIYTIEWLASEAGRFEFLLSNDDHVVVNVYDPRELAGYSSIKTDVFEYREIDGTALKAGDDWVGTIESPFAIPFGGEENKFYTVNVGANGGLSFTDTAPISIDNSDLPNNNFVSFVAPLWTDLDPSSDNGDIFYQTIGDEPNREFVIEWRDVPYYGSGDTTTFQVVFFESSSDILFNYLNVSSDYSSRSTIGVQSTEERFLQLGINEFVIESNTSLRFSLSGNNP